MLLSRRKSRLQLRRLLCSVPVPLNGFARSTKQSRVQINAILQLLSVDLLPSFLIGASHPTRGHCGHWSDGEAGQPDLWTEIQGRDLEPLLINNLQGKGAQKTSGSGEEKTRDGNVVQCFLHSYPLSFRCHKS